MNIDDDVDSELLEALEASFNDSEDPEADESPIEDELSIEADAEEYVDDAPDTEATEDSEEPEPATVFEAPKHWSSDQRAKFDALPDDAKALVIDRDADFQRGYQERVKGITEVEQALEPWQQAIAQRGLSPANAIRTLLAAQASLERDPVNGILNLANSLGIQDQLKGVFAPDTSDDYSDPVVKDLKQEIAGLKQQLGQFGQSFEQSRTNSVNEQLSSFVQAKDDKGELKHPYFEQVRHLMAPLVGQGKSMEDAYAQAVWTVDEFRQKSNVKAQTDPAAKAKKVAQAKKAARSVRQVSNGRNKDPEEAMSIEQGLRQDWKKLAS